MGAYGEIDGWADMMGEVAPCGGEICHRAEELRRPTLVLLTKGSALP